MVVEAAVGIVVVVVVVEVVSFTNKGGLLSSLIERVVTDVSISGSNRVEIIELDFRLLLSRRSKENASKNSSLFSSDSASRSSDRL